MPTEQPPCWKTDFPIDWEEDSRVSRRLFTRVLTGASLALFVGNGYVKRVHGYNTLLSEMVLNLANEMPRTPEIQIRHQWRKGDIAIWDNLGTAHYGVAGDIGDQFRRLYRVAAWSKNVRPSLDRARAMRELLASQTAAPAH